MNEEILDSIETNNTLTQVGADSATYTFKATTVDEIAGKIEKYLLEKGYKLERGSTKNGIYGKGNKVLRVLLGAFVKRFTWKVTVNENGSNTTLIFAKDGKGYLGGAIGVAQVKKEYKRITDSLTAFHASFKKRAV